MSITNLQKVEAIEGIATKENYDMLLSLASGIGIDRPAMSYHELRQLRIELVNMQRLDTNAIEEAYIQVKEKMATTYFRGWGKWNEVLATAMGMMANPDAYITIEVTRKAGGKRIDIVIKED